MRKDIAQVDEGEVNDMNPKKKSKIDIAGVDEKDDQEGYTKVGKKPSIQKE